MASIDFTSLNLIQDEEHENDERMNSVNPVLKGLDLLDSNEEASSMEVCYYYHGTLNLAGILITW